MRQIIYHPKPQGAQSLIKMASHKFTKCQYELSCGSRQEKKKWYKKYAWVPHRTIDTIGTFPLPNTGWAYLPPAQFPYPYPCSRYQSQFWHYQMSTCKSLTKMHIMKGVIEMCAELWEPTRNGKEPKDKQQQETFPPLEVKGKVEDRQGVGWQPDESWGEAQAPLSTQVQVEPCKSNSLRNYQVKHSRCYKGLHAFGPELLYGWGFSWGPKGRCESIQKTGCLNVDSLTLSLCK